METFAVGDVILVPFPFTNLSQAKKRPAVILKDAGHGDYLVAMITSKGLGDPCCISVPERDRSAVSLDLQCAVRYSRIFITSSEIITAKLGTFSADFTKRLREAFLAWITT